MDNKKELGQRINAALAMRDKKQKELANAIGVTDNTISYFCGGKRTPNLQQIIAIAKELNVSTDYLLGVSGTPSVDEDIQVACKTTGLTENAVDAIKKFGESRDVLNHILKESDYLEDILIDIDKLAWEESTRKAAEVSANARIDRGPAMRREDIRDFTIKVLVEGKAEERRDVIEYRILKKFKKLLDIVVNDFTVQKEYREYGARMLEAGYYKEVEFFNEMDELDKETGVEGEDKDHGKH